MATFHQTPEEGRPPESPNSQMFKEQHPWNKIKLASYVNDNNSTTSGGLRNFKETNRSRHILKQSLPKLLCLKKLSPAEANPLMMTLNVSALNVNKNNLNNLNYDESASKIYLNNLVSSNTASCSTSENNRQKNRNSLHQNVEEALSSLLWQPYEYQNKKQNVPPLLSSSSSSSSCTCCSCSNISSCCSSVASSSFDLDENTNNSPLEEERCTSYVDLYLPTTEMVNNLAYKNQSLMWPVQPCDPNSLLSTSRLLLATVSSTECSPQRTATVAPLVNSAEVVSCCDVNSSDMQLEVPTNSTNNVSCSAPQNNILNISTNGGGDGLIRQHVTTIVPSGNINNNNISGRFNDNVFHKQSSSSNNLSSANVVGLPSHHHPRYGSVPANITGGMRTTGNSTIFPNHPRNGSEPNTVSNQFRYNNNSAVSNTTSSTSNNTNVVLHHQRQTSQLDQTNLQLISHLRSSSVPKSMPRSDNIQNQTKPSSNNNISNVNVNFYRAVPVNVVSSVPTIHCLNTLNSTDGNNISNVQIMPLGNSNTTTNSPPSHFSGPNNLQINNINQSVPTMINTNSNAILSTTQVTVHNPTNSIQIPSTNLRSTVSTNTQQSVNRNNQVVIQNNRVGTTTITRQNNTMVNTSTDSTRTRTFTSTEAQTDEITVCPPEVPSAATREQRRRERRERRHQRRVNNVNHRHTAEHGTQANENNSALPDLLNNHLPPPYSPMPGIGNNGPPPPPPNIVSGLMPNPNAGLLPPPPPPQLLGGPPPPPHSAVLQTVVPNSVVPSGFAFPPPTVLQGQVPLVQGAAPVAVTVPPPTGFRFPFPASGFRRGRFSEEPPKSCCGLLSWKPGSLRWFIALIALVAVCCVLVGTALGAMRPAGRDHLTVSLLMIGVGIVLVTVSGVAWRLTSHDSSTCRSMLGLGSTESVDVCTRRFVPRLPPSYGRPHHPYAAMMYPEFQYRPPPPSYQASMQEYRLRLLLLDRGNTPQIQAGIQNAVSPPPTYRSHAGSLLRAPLSSRRDGCGALSEYSCPPSYRSQNSTAHRQGTLTANSILHSREQSLSLSESNNGESVVNVVNILGSTEEDIALDNITLDSLKMEPENDINPLRMLLKGSSSDLEGSKDGNLVTIVQTSDQSPVIVTVSGSSQIDHNHHNNINNNNNNNNSSAVQITEIPSEMEILAHL